MKKQPDEILARMITAGDRWGVGGHLRLRQRCIFISSKSPVKFPIITKPAHCSPELTVNKSNNVPRCRTELCYAAFTDWNSHHGQVSFDANK